MKEEVVKLIINAIQLLGLLGLSIFGLLSGWRIWVKERAHGAQTVIELVEAGKKVTQDIDQLKTKVADHDEDLERLEREHREFMLKIFDYLKK